MKRLVIPLLLILGLTETLRANTMWQAALFEPDILAKVWWVIPAGLLIEWPVVRVITSFIWFKSLWITIFMNIISFFVGMALQVPTMALRGAVGTVALVAIAILGSTFIEGFVINRFRRRAVNLKTFPLLLLVNAASGCLTLAVLAHVW